jgi:hypothetical protein
MIKHANKTPCISEPREFLNICCYCRYFYWIPAVKPNRCTCFSNYLFLHNTLHVSDGLSVHHQEFKTVHTATVICQTDCYMLASKQVAVSVWNISFPLAAVSSICLTCTCCCMYSLELLMMDGKTVRNM